jgi:hypothetical protein
MTGATLLLLKNNVKIRSRGSPISTSRDFRTYNPFDFVGLMTYNNE